MNAKLGIFHSLGTFISVPGYAPREAREFRVEEIGAEQKRVKPLWRSGYFKPLLRVPQFRRPRNFTEMPTAPNITTTTSRMCSNADNSIMEPGSVG